MASSEISMGAFKRAYEEAMKAAKGFFIGNDDKLERLVRSSGFYNPTNKEWYNKFSRFQVLNPWRRLAYTKEYLFFTKPDLIIYAKHPGPNGDMYINEKNREKQNGIELHYENTYRVPFFRELDLHYKDVLQQLQYSCDLKLPFMNLLSNAKRSNLELADIQASADVDSPANIFGTKISYRGTSYTSDDGYDFTVDFEDSKYLEIYRFLKAYDLYENRKHLGLISIPQLYVDNKILHDQFSIYKFILDEDFSTILYWAKLTGCYIKSVPRASFSDLSETGGITYTVSFRCSFIEDMTPEILADFNLVSDLARNSGDIYSPLYDPTIDSSNPDWCDYPYIIYEDLDTQTTNLPNNNNSNKHVLPKLVWNIRTPENNKLTTFSYRNPYTL